jgi:hypothetical protein
MALFIYVFGTYFSSNFVLIFVMCILMLAMDFWTVQNVSGRLLVGLRWWNEIKEDGTSDWRFESIRDPSSLVASDATLFWAALVAAPVLWGLFAMSALISLKLSWLLIVGIAVSLNCSNLIGYFKCRKGAPTHALIECFGLRITFVRAVLSVLCAHPPQTPANSCRVSWHKGRCKQSRADSWVA